MKNLVKSDVYDVALDLIEENGSTTTLDVKNELRTRGFFAKQADVSEFMLEVAAEEKWDFTYNGVHRVYTIKVASVSNQLKAAGNTGCCLTSTAGVTKVTSDSYTKRDGTTIETMEDCDADTGDFRVWSVDSNDELYFSGNEDYTRSDIRFAFSKITGEAFEDTRVETLK
jgi:hypothetical protein